MKEPEIHDDREFYEAVHEYSANVWRWRAHFDETCEIEPTPDELITILETRIEWVNEHKRIVDKYLRKRNGPSWVRVISNDVPNPGEPRGICSPLKTDDIKQFEASARVVFGDIESCSTTWNDPGHPPP